MLIGQEVLMIGKARLVDASFWETILFHGSARNRNVCPCPPLKPNTLLQEAVVPN